MHRSLRIAAILLLATACASKPAAPPPPPAPVAPPASELARSGLAVVADADLTIRDPSRGRDIPIHVSYPNGNGPFPVIVFSHGAGGTGESYRPLSRFWATRGYVVLAPTHADSASGRANPKSLDVLRETAADALQDPKAWENRVGDLTYTIFSLEEIGAKVGPLAGKLDGGRLGVAGHSYGAFTAQLLAGATVSVAKGGRPKSFADPAPKAFLLLSPQGKGQQGLTEGSWAAVTRPLMAMTGSRDKGVKGQDPSWRLDPYRLSPPGDKYAVLLEGAGHLSFTGRAAEPGAALPAGKGKDAVAVDQEVAIFKQVKIASLAFWDAYLSGDANARAFLDSDALTKESAGKAKIERR
jgi:predicted dienelactone hydrolase